MGRKTLMKYIRLFDEDILGKYRILAKKIRKESGIRGIFMKADRSNTILELKKCMEKAALIDPKRIKVDHNDDEAIMIRGLLDDVLTMFYGLCMSQSELQEFLIRKDNKEEVSVKEMNDLMSEVAKNNMGMKVAWEKINKIIR